MHQQKQAYGFDTDSSQIDQVKVTVDCKIRTRKFPRESSLNNIRLMNSHFSASC